MAARLSRHAAGRRPGRGAHRARDLAREPARRRARARDGAPRLRAPAGGARRARARRGRGARGARARGRRAGCSSCSRASSLVGFGLGLVVSFAFRAAETAGHLVDVLRGASLAEVLVPTVGGAREPRWRALYGLLATLVFLELGGVPRLLEALARELRRRAARGQPARPPTLRAAASVVVVVVGAPARGGARARGARRRRALAHRPRARHGRARRAAGARLLRGPARQGPAGRGRRAARASAPSTTPSRPSCRSGWSWRGAGSRPGPEARSRP